MKSFKDFVTEDNEVFFNTSEFAEKHNVAGETCNVIFVDESTDKTDAKFNDDYISSNEFSFIVLKSEIGFKPLVDKQLTFDGRMYTVVSVVDSMDSYTITLGTNEG